MKTRSNISFRLDLLRSVALTLGLLLLAPGCAQLDSDPGQASATTLHDGVVVTTHYEDNSADEASAVTRLFDRDGDERITVTSDHGTLADHNALHDQVHDAWLHSAEKSTSASAQTASCPLPINKWFSVSGLAECIECLDCPGVENAAYNFVQKLCRCNDWY